MIAGGLAPASVAGLVESLGVLVGLLVAAGLILFQAQRQLRHRLRRISLRLDDVEDGLDRLQDEQVPQRAQRRLLTNGTWAATLRADMLRPTTLAAARAARRGDEEAGRLALAAPSCLGLDQLAFQASGGARQGTYLEVGAGDGRTDAATWLLEAIGWRGALIEADPDAAGRCAVARPGSTTTWAAATAPGHGARGAFYRVQGGRDVAGLPPSTGLGFVHPTDAAWRAVIEAGAQTQEVQVPLTTLDAVLGAGDATPLDLLVVGCPTGALEVLRGLDLKRHAPRLAVIACPEGEDLVAPVRAWMAGAGFVAVGAVADRLVFVAGDAADVRERIAASPLLMPLAGTDLSEAAR